LKILRKRDDDDGGIYTKKRFFEILIKIKNYKWILFDGNKIWGKVFRRKNVSTEIVYMNQTCFANL
jgi:hypothetical protein